MNEKLLLFTAEKFSDFVEWKRNKDGKEFDETAVPVTISHMTKLDSSIKFIATDEFVNFYLLDENKNTIQHITWIHR